jgi:autotransporter passenger strand-loop-strand repeat protein
MSGTPPSYISGTQISGGFTYTGGESVYIVSGGQAYNMTIDKSSEEDVGPGGRATGTIINASGSALVDSAGTTIDSVVNKGGEEDVFGGTASASKLSGGVQSVSSGIALKTIVYSGGVEDVSSAGTDTGTVISKGGGEHVYSGGISYSATVTKGGTDFITQGGSASVATVKAGGRMILAGDVLYDGDFTVTSGSARAVGVYKGGIETITFTGLKNSPYNEIVNTATSTGYVRNYEENGAVVFEEQRIGNEVYYTSGGKTFSSTSPQYTAPGAASDVTIASGGSAVLAGGSISKLTIASGGTEIIGGKTTVHSASGVYKFNFSGVTVKGGSIGKGARQIVNAGNIALSATITAGGEQIVKAGATAQDTVIDGGKVNLAATAKLASAVTFAGKGGELVISATTLPTATISGFGAGDKIQLAGVVYSAGATATVKTAGVVTITDGSNSYKLNIAGAAVGQAFSFSSGSILTTTAAAKMNFVAPAAATFEGKVLPAMATAPAGAVMERSGWVKETPIPGAGYALLTSAAPAIVAPVTLSGGFGE